jgi:hypothetical protein
MVSAPSEWAGLVAAIRRYRSASWSGVNPEAVADAKREAHARLDEVLGRSGEGLYIGQMGERDDIDTLWVILGVPMLMPPDELAPRVGKRVADAVGLTKEVEALEGPWEAEAEVAPVDPSDDIPF